LRAGRDGFLSERHLEILYATLTCVSGGSRH
jgi:hypothetical protein